MKLGSMLFFLLLAVIFPAGFCRAQEIYPLYPDAKITNSIPAENLEKWETDSLTGTVRVSKVSLPTIQVFKTTKPGLSRAAVLICPGGAYIKLGMNVNGTEVTKAFNEAGVTAFVLKYRLPSDRTMPQKSLGPIQDARRAMQFVKENAVRWDIDTSQVGVVGFSAGGHLASSLGTSFRDTLVDQVPASVIRPAFMVLVYPVISMGRRLGNPASTENLLGQQPSAAQIARFSNELHVDSHTPPAFIVHAADDRSVPVKSSLLFYETLLDHGVKAELLIYPYGGHGFGLHNSTTPDQWIAHCINWMISNHWVTKKQIQF